MTVSYIEEISPLDTSYTNVLVLAVKEDYDFNLNCKGYTVSNGDGGKFFLPNITNDKDNYVKIGDTVNVYTTGHIIRGVIHENKKVWFYYGPNSTKNLEKKLTEVQIEIAKEQSEELFARLDEMYDALSDIWKHKVNFFRGLSPDFRLICEERELILLGITEKIFQKLRDRFSGSFNDMGNWLRNYDISADYASIVSGVAPTEISSICELLKLRLMKKTKSVVSMVFPHVSRHLNGCLNHGSYGAAIENYYKSHVNELKTVE